MTRFLDRWNDTWLAPGSPLRLGAARAVCFGGVFLLYLRHDFSPWAEVGSAFWRPVWALRVLGLPRPTPAAIEVVQLVWKASLLLACVGLFARAAAATGFALGLYLLGFGESWGKIGHASAHVVLLMGVLAVARAGDAFSLDAWRRGRVAAPSGEHTWPIRAAALVLALMIFAGGVAKLRAGGPGWLRAETLAGVLRDAADNGAAHPPPLAGLGVWIAGHPALCVAGATATVVIELLYPLVLFSRRSRRVLLPAAVLLFAAIGLLVVPAFGATVLLGHAAFWVPWDRLLARRGPRVRPA